MLSLGDVPAFTALALAVVLSSSAPATDSSQRRELTQLRTEHSRTYQNADGTRTTVTSLTPLNYRDADGRLRPISTRLVPHATASVINEAGDFRVAFDKRLGNRFVRIEEGRARVGLTLEGARPASAEVSGSAVRYSEVAEGASLEYEALPHGVKETIVLDGPEAPATFRFRLAPLAGARLQAQRLRDGSWVISGRGSRFHVEAPWAVDARGAGRRDSGAKLVITRDGNDLLLEVSLSRSWLRAPRRAFPVRLDPTITTDWIDWSTFDGSCANCPGTQWYTTKLGTTATETWRTWLRFNLAAIPADARVTAASFRMEHDGTCLVPPSGNCGEHIFGMHRVTAFGEFPAQHQHEGLAQSSMWMPAGAPPGWLTWNVTNLTRDWHTGTQPNLGLIVKRMGETANANGIQPIVSQSELVVTYALDDITLYGPEDVTQSGATLRWSRYGGTAFAGYEVHRSATSGFTPSASTRLATLAMLDETTYTDSTAAPGTPFYYKVMVGTRVSNELRIALPGPTDPSLTVLQPGPAAGQSTTIAASPGTCTNLSHEPTIDVGTQSRGLVRFDLDSVDPHSQIASAKLSLWRNEPTGTGWLISAAPVAREWREATTSDCTADGATWLQAYGGVTWTDPGADIHDGGVTTGLASGPPGWQDLDVTALVKDWVAGRRANHGVRIATNGGPLVRFASDDDSYSPVLRPKLEISYEDPTPVGIPTATMLSPGSGDRVRDTIAVEAAAGDDRRVERVEFLLDGSEFSEDTTAPYVVNWDTRLDSNGSHTLRARAVDDAGNVGLSDPLTVDVANFAPPAVGFTRPPSTYAAAVLADPAAGQWRLGETAGTTAADTSGNGRHGTYAGSYTRGLAGLLTGDPDLSVRLAAGSGIITLGGFGGLLGSQVSAEAWVKHPGLTANNTETRVVSRNHAGTGGWKLGVRRTSTGAQQAFFAVGSVTALVAIAPTSTSIYHLVGTYDGTQVRLYLDGREVASATATGALNTTASPLIGGTPAANLHVDEVALYPAALTAEQVKAHYELGQGRNFWVEGSNELRVNTSPAAGRTIREVQFLIDDQLIASDGAAPYTITWNTLAAGAVVPDGSHVLTARAIDDHDRETTTALTVTVGNNKAPDQQAEITAASELPETLVDESAPWDGDVQVDVKIKNTGTATIAGGAAVLRYRFIRPDGTFDDSVSGSSSLGTGIAPGAERIVSVTVRPPNLQPGMTRSRMTLRFDLRDTTGAQTWWAARGNPPLDHSVLVQREGTIGLGLERFYHYDAEALGGGMTNLVNLASGNNIIRFSPFAAPGRGLSTVVDLTYNAQAGESRGSAVGAAWWLSISSLSPFGEPLRCGYGSQYELKPKKCEEIALEGGGDKSGLAMDLVDADGTVHRFTGRRTGGRTFWAAPQGVHLYLHQLEADEQPSCDITENGMQYTSYQSAIRALWAFTRPDGVTFYYQRNGWPTGVRDRNGNCLDFELVAPGADQDRVRVTEVVDAAGVATPPLRSRRSFTLEYYDSGHHHKHGGKDRTPKIKAIRDHTGSRIWFEYYKDDRLNKIGQDGGTTPDGVAAPPRSWSFTYTRWWDDDDEYTVARIASASERVHPDHNINDNSNLIYSVRDPRGNETKFEYYGRHPHAGKTARLKLRTDRAGHGTTFGYDTSARTTTLQRPLGRDTRYEFDAEGSMLRTIDKLGATVEETTSVSWTADRHVFKITEPTGEFTEFVYNQNGYLTKQWDQLRRMTELQYEHLPVDDDDTAAGWADPGREIQHISQLTKRITPRARQWQFDHDDSTGNLLKIVDPEGFTSRYEYYGDGTMQRSHRGLLDNGTFQPAPGDPSRVTLFESYDANGLPTKVTDPVGAVTRFCNDDDGLLRWVQRPRHAGEPAPGDPNQCVQHPGRGYRSYFDYDPLHRLARTSDPKAKELEALLWTHARYDANDNVVADFGPQASPAFRDGAGTRTSMTYDAMDRLRLETLNDVDTTLGPGNELQQSPRPETSELHYDAAGRIAQITNPRGYPTPSLDDYSVRYTYDLLDRRLIEIAKGVSEERRTHYCYDSAGDIRSITGPRAERTSVACEDGAAPAGTPFTQRREYTAAHELRKVVDPSGDVATQTYDLDGNPDESTDAEGAKVNRTYDGRNLLIEAVEDFETDPPARRLTTKVEYDAAGNVRHFYAPRAVDAAAPGNPTPSSDFVETTEYDGLDRPTRVLLPKRGSEARRYVHRRYDADGNLDRITVPVTEGDLGAILGSEAETRRWVTRYEHWDPGWIKTARNINGGVAYDYTPEGWQESRKPLEPGNDNDTFRTYYRDGLLETLKDEKDNTILHRYDLNSNLTFIRDAGVSSERRPLTFDIDHNGFDEISSTTAREENRHTRTTTFSYLLDGLLRTRDDDRENDAGGALVRAARRNVFSYDEDGRLTAHEDFGRQAGRADDKLVTFSYSATDRENERIVEHWIGSDTEGSFEPRQTTRRDYFANGLLQRLRTYGGDDEDDLRLRESHTLVYRDPGGVFVNGHRTRDVFFRASPNADAPCRTATSTCEQRWAYDGGDRLIEENDGRGNRTGYTLATAGGVEQKTNAATGAVKTSATFDGTRMVTFAKAGAATLHMHYDVHGNLDCTTTPSGSEDDCNEGTPQVVQEFDYDYRNRLTAWRAGATSTRFDHDAIDRVVKQVDDRGSSTSTRELSYVGASRDVSEEEETGPRTITRSYSYDAFGRRIGVTYKRAMSPARELTYAHDPHGNVSMLINEAGDVRASYGYTAYGEADQALTAERVPDTDGDPAADEQVNAFRYSDKRTDAISGTIDMGARQFGPDIAQFLQEDRFDGALGDLDLVSDPLTANRYGLAGGNPVSFIEWDGHGPLIDAAGDSETRSNIMEDFVKGQNRRAARQRASGPSPGGAEAPSTDLPTNDLASSGAPGGRDPDEGRRRKASIPDLAAVFTITGAWAKAIAERNRFLHGLNRGAREETRNRERRLEKRKKDRAAALENKGRRGARRIGPAVGPAATGTGFLLQFLDNLNKGQSPTGALRRALVSTTVEAGMVYGATTLCTAVASRVPPVIAMCPTAAVAAGVSGIWVGGRINEGIDEFERAAVENTPEILESSGFPITPPVLIP